MEKVPLPSGQGDLKCACLQTIPGKKKVKEEKGTDNDFLLGVKDTSLLLFSFRELLLLGPGD